MMWLSRRAVALVVCAGGWAVPGGFSASAQETTTDAIKMIDTDKDGTIDLAEVKAAAAAVFLKIDRGHDGIVGAQDLAGRMVTVEQLSQGPNPWMFWRTRTRYTKDQYLVLAETWFVAVDANNDGTVDAKELQTAAGQQLLKLLQ
jgi:EF hand